MNNNQQEKTCVFDLQGLYIRNIKLEPRPDMFEPFKNRKQISEHVVEHNRMNKYIGYLKMKFL